MKAIKLVTMIALMSAVGVSCTFAQPFSSGSDGSYGALVVSNGTTVTLDMPPDGMFKCTTITIGAGATLRFKRNVLNTPVYLLATGDVVINGNINVSGEIATLAAPGQGGPGGFDGGKPGNGPNVPSGDGLGPGGGKGTAGLISGTGGGSYATRPNNLVKAGETYGNPAIIPLIGGSGGGGTSQPGAAYGGAGGGGAILIASDTSIYLIDRITANGGFGGNAYGAGSGGAIRLVAPIVKGAGYLLAVPYQANNDQGDPSQLCCGGMGRIRVDTTNRYSLNINTRGSYSGGSYMHVFPPGPIPRLDIVEAAGQTIPEGTNAPVRVVLPIGGSTNQTIKLQAFNFTGVIPIHVVVTPENAPSTTYTNQINMGTGNPAQLTVNVVIPAGTASTISAWTR